MFIHFMGIFFYFSWLVEKTFFNFQEVLFFLEIFSNEMKGHDRGFAIMNKRNISVI